MTYEADIEAVVVERPELGPHERGTLRNYLRRLFKYAKPGNLSWRKLENEFGFSGDYTEADHGMHWSDNERV